MSPMSVRECSVRRVVSVSTLEVAHALAAELGIQIVSLRRASRIRPLQASQTNARQGASHSRLQVVDVCSELEHLVINARHVPSLFDHDHMELRVPLYGLEISTAFLQPCLPKSYRAIVKLPKCTSTWPGL